MRAVIIQDRQTLWDIATQYCGDREAAFQIADINDISLTEELPAGFSLTVPSVFNQKIVDYYKANSIAPATGSGMETVNAENVIVTNDGMRIMANNNNNIQIVTNV